VNVPARKAQRRIAKQHTGEQAGLDQNLEAIADAKDKTALRGKTRHFLHHGRETRNRATPEIVPVGKSPGKNHDIDTPQVRIFVPEEEVSDYIFRRGGGVVAIGSREHDNPELTGACHAIFSTANR
jgi:hypothetical protein